MPSMSGECISQCEAVIETLTDVWEALDAGEKYEEEDPDTFLWEYVLEVKRNPFTLVVTTGGPQVEILRGPTGATMVEATWGDDQERRYSPILARTLRHFEETWS